MARWVVSVHQTWNLQTVFAFRDFLPTVDGDQTKDDSFVVVDLLLGRRGAGLAALHALCPLPPKVFAH